MYTRMFLVLFSLLVFHPFSMCRKHIKILLSLLNHKHSILQQAVPAVCHAQRCLPFILLLIPLPQELSHTATRHSRNTHCSHKHGHVRTFY